MSLIPLTHTHTHTHTHTLTHPHAGPWAVVGLESLKAEENRTPMGSVRVTLWSPANPRQMSAAASKTESAFGAPPADAALTLKIVSGGRYRASYAIFSREEATTPGAGCVDGCAACGGDPVAARLYSPTCEGSVTHRHGVNERRITIARRGTFSHLGLHLGISQGGARAQGARAQQQCEQMEPYQAECPSDLADAEATGDDGQ